MRGRTGGGARVAFNAIVGTRKNFSHRKSIGGDEKFMSTAASIHQQVASLWNQRDFAGLRNLMDPEYSYTGADGKEMTGGPDVGVGIAQMFASAFPDGTLEVKKV